MANYTADEWYALSKHLYEAISKDMEEALKSETSYQIYPNLVVEYEFFKLLRGDGFFYSRPTGIEQQAEIFSMENSLQEKLAKVAEKLDPNDEKVDFCLKEMKKSFDLI